MSFSRGALYLLLRNRLYRGEVHHGGKHHPGLHKPIVPKELWETVQSKLDSNLRAHQVKEKAKAATLLSGMVFNETGLRFTATHTLKNGRRHQYYWLRPRHGDTTHVPMSIPAHDLDRLVEAEWVALLSAKDLDRQLGVDRAEESRLVRRAAQALAHEWQSLTSAEKRTLLLNGEAKVRVAPDCFTLTAARNALRAQFLGAEASCAHADRSTQITRTVKAKFLRVGSEKRVLEDRPVAICNATEEVRGRLLRTIALGRKWIAELANGDVASLKDLGEREKRAESYLYDVLRVACLSPRLVTGLIHGSTIPKSGMAHFQRNFPGDWEDQTAIFRA